MRDFVLNWRVRVKSIMIGSLFFASAGFAEQVPVSAAQMIKDMGIGWNLGNTLDAWVNGVTGLATETSWGNPKTTKAMFDALKAKGFRTVRVPVTWRVHFSESSPYTIEKEWLDRVQEVVDYGITNGMYVILNSHHDEWVTLSTATQTAVTDKITKIWAQIATRFKDYDNHLVMETLNEPRLYGAAEEWTGGTPEARKVLNAYNLAIVNTIRGTGGNNASRYIMVPTHAATALDVAQNDLVIPNNDSKIIVSQHTYWPYSFTMENPGTNTWGTAQDKADCDAELDRICNKFVKKGIQVVVGEWGTIDKSNTAARKVHAEYYAAGVIKRGMLPIWWDNGDSKAGGFALLNRNAGSWYFPEIVDALVKAAPTDLQPAKNSTGYNRNSIEVFSRNVKYFIPVAGDITLLVYDMQGRTIWSVVNRNQPSGNHQTIVPFQDFSSGTYMIMVKGTGYSATKSFMTIK